MGIPLLPDAVLEGPESFLVHEVASSDNMLLNLNTSATVSIVDGSEFTIAMIHVHHEAPH